MFRNSVEQTGFAVIPNILSEGEAAQTARDLELAALKRSRAGIRHLMSNPTVARLSRDQRLLSIASEILDREAIPFRATLFDKSSEANWLVVWHQDTALPLRERREAEGWGPWSVKDGVTYAHAPTQALEQVIALRLHFDNSTVENGPLRVLPGTHKLGVLTDSEVSCLSEERRSVDCLASSGSVLAMRPLLIHASSKSQHDSPRRVLHIEYASSMAMENGLELAVV